MTSMSATTLDTSEACARVVRAFSRMEQVTALGHSPDFFSCSTKSQAPRVSPDCTRAFKIPWYVTKLAGMLLSDISLNQTITSLVHVTAVFPCRTSLP